MAAQLYVFSALTQDKIYAVAIKYESGLQSRCGRFGIEENNLLIPGIEP